MIVIFIYLFILVVTTAAFYVFHVLTQFPSTNFHVNKYPIIIFQALNENKLIVVAPCNKALHQPSLSLKTAGFSLEVIHLLL